MRTYCPESTMPSAMFSLNVTSNFIHEFNRSLGVSLEEASPEEFQARVTQGERMQGLPDPASDFLTADFLLPRVIRDVADGSTMRKITGWLTERYTP
jgi:hypothetical protein